MARYTHSLKIAAPVNYLQQVLVNTLHICNFETIYSTGDYLMARETPGEVPFTKLVTVEILIDNTTASGEETNLNFVVKNEELPLQANNHCYQMYNRVSQALENNDSWELVESVVGLETSRSSLN